MVDNLPTVPPEKVDKLTTVLKKLFGQIGTIREGQRQAHTVSCGGRPVLEGCEGKPWLCSVACLRSLLQWLPHNGRT